MSFKFTNKHKLSLAIAPFLALDEYDHNPDPNTISATTLMKPIRRLVLDRTTAAAKTLDIIDMVPASMGTAMHSRLEKAWLDKATREKVFDLFGHSHMNGNIHINPKEPTAEIDVYTEKRFFKKLGKYTLTGQSDLIINKRLHDLKTTSVWGVIFGSNEEDYILQGSIYRWLSDGIIKQPEIDIEFIFTDWSKSSALKDRSYPQQRVMQKSYPLWSLEETEEWITNKLALLDQLSGLPQDKLPLCTPKELWQKDAKYKYYKKVDAKRATKVYPTMQEAQDRLQKEGCGEVKHFPGEVKACEYCPVINICDQAKSLKVQGLLVI